MKKATLNLFLLLLVTLVILPFAFGAELKCYIHGDDVMIDAKGYMKAGTKPCASPNEVCFKSMIKGRKSVKRGCRKLEIGEELTCQDGLSRDQTVTVCYCDKEGCNKGGALVIPSLGTLLLISVPAFFLY